MPDLDLFVRIVKTFGAPERARPLRPVATLLRACGAALVFAALTPAVAQGPSAEDRYIAARDQAIARFERVKDLTDKVQEDERRARAAVEKQMRTALGPVELPGFDAGELNVESLFRGDQGFGTLDGLRFKHNGGEREITVTTRSLLMRWLQSEARIWKTPALRQPETAFRLPKFYTQAVNTGAAAVRFADLPLGGEAGKPAYAMLVSRTQDQTPYAADEVLVAAIKGERAFVAIAAFKPSLAIEACRAARTAAEKKLEAASRSGRAGKGWQDAEAKTAAIDATFLRCFAERAAREPRLAEAVKLAQALYAQMPAK